MTRLLGLEKTRISPMAIEEPGELLILVCNSNTNNVDGEDVILLNLLRVINKKKSNRI